MIKVGIVGASGYTGGELLRILKNHEKAKVAVVTRSEAKETIDEVHPHLRGAYSLKFESNESEKLKGCDVVFCCLPHGVSLGVVPKLLGHSRVIDLSADFRFSDHSIYEKHYGPHPSKELCEKAVYGLPELHRKKIAKAELVANPGCFPTAAILGTYPLVKEKIAERIVIDAKTGISGAGNKPIEKTHYPVVADTVTPYNVGSHRHKPEIEKELGMDVAFIPHLVPMIRGILSTIHVFGRDLGRIWGAYEKYYAGEPFIRLVKSVPKVNAVRGSNFCDIGGIYTERDYAVSFSVIDNLVKGASGQAVQNMNIMFGLEETAGLEASGIYP